MIVPGAAPQRAKPACVASDLPYRLPLVIGVTGHRDLRPEDIARLEHDVRQVFSRIVRDYLGEDGATPIVVMSSLAEGADQLVARIALDIGAALVAPLPMSAPEYRTDFENGLSANAAQAFDALLRRATSAPVMPLVEGNTAENIRTDNDRRARQYREAGLFIVRHCHILLSLWDGDMREMKTGGTAEIVAIKKKGFSLRGGESARDCIDGTEIGPVITISTPRRSAPDKGVEVVTLPWGRELVVAARQDRALEAEAKIWQDLESSVALTASFNRDARRALSTATGKENCERSLIQLFQSPTTHESSARARALGVHVAPLWCAIYVIADVLAQDYQQRFKRIWTSLFLLAFLMAAAIGFPSGPYFSKAYALIVYQTLFACSIALYLLARRQQYQAKYLDYRALSETARVGVFWKAAGVGKAVAAVYPICQPLELAWVRLSLKSLDCFDPGDRSEAPPLGAAPYRVCHDVWVRGQFEYFRDSGRRHAEKAKHSKMLSLAFVVIGGLGTAMIGLSGFLGSDWKSVAPFNSATFIPLGLELLPAAGAAIQGYAEQLGRTAQALQYERMRMLYECALAILPETVEEGDEDAVREVFLELGREAIQETASWTSIFRLRPLRPI